MSGWSFYALGDPVPQGSKRHVGGGRMIESSKALAPWRDTIVAAGYGAGECLDGPVALTAWFTLRRPKSAPKRLQYPAKKPDIDKLARAVLDAVVIAGLLHDDAQVVRLDVLKGWPREPGDCRLPVPGVVVAACEPTWPSGLLAGQACNAAHQAHKKAS